MDLRSPSARTDRYKATYLLTIVAALKRPTADARIAERSRAPTASMACVAWSASCTMKPVVAPSMSSRQFNPSWWRSWATGTERPVVGSPLINRALPKVAGSSGKS